MVSKKNAELVEKLINEPNADQFKKVAERLTLTDLIINKRVDLELLRKSVDSKDYNLWQYGVDTLTDSEYQFIKENI